jgi:hypothetical protein
MSDRRRLAVLLAPVALLVLLAAAWLMPAVAGLQLERRGDDARRWEAALDALPSDPVVLVGFDPDLGTYAEIRPTVRTLLADLLNRGARLAFVNLTPEGRALLLAELDRLERAEANPTRLLDLGYVPGAEAALVSLVRELPLREQTGSLARQLAAGGGIEAIDAAVVVGGNDIGPRSWVEQVAPRVGDLPLLAVAPTVLLPELLPYLESGQLAGLLATPGEGAAYRAGAALGPLDRLVEAPPSGSLPILAGLVVAIVFLAQAWLGRAIAGARQLMAPDDA